MKNSKRGLQVYSFKKLEGKVAFAKGVIISLTRSVANKFVLKGIRVNKVIPDKSQKTSLARSGEIAPSYVFLVPNPDVRGGNGWINCADLNKRA